MITRFLSSAPIGMAITASLFYLMNLLIVIGPGPDLSQHERFDLTFGRTIVEGELIVDEQKPDPIDQPKTLPPIQPRPEYDGESGHPGVPLPPPLPIDTSGHGTTFPGLSDGPLANIVRVLPVYPAALAQKGVEGYVIVQFDVSAVGAVHNTAVIESSHSGFHRSAVNAAAKFRYKPRVIDGEAMSVVGLKHKFTFKMEN